MNAATQNNFLVREEPIPRLERIVFAVVQAAKRPAPERDRILAALRSALSAQCLRCGTRVSGEDLVLLSGLPDDEETPGMKRLRSGRCVRDGCRFENYRLVFQNHPDLDWAGLLAPAAAEPDAPSETTAPEPAAETPVAGRSERRQIAIRVGILVVILMLLWVARQLYFGGRIPLLREPEHFKVTPGPEKQPHR